MSRKIPFIKDNYYHIYNRGTEERKIFLNESYYQRFAVLLYLCNNTEPVRSTPMQGRTLQSMLKEERENTLVNICTYCLMPNHFHLLIQEKTDGGISKFMQKLLTAYTMYFNTKNERTGALFQGKFKAKLINEDRYFWYLISYIHLNPIKLIEPSWKETGIINKKSAEKFLQKYKHSSYLDYCGRQRLEQVLINKTSLPEDINSPKDIADMANNLMSL